ncbi:MAG TPA: hypothetical protein VFR68_09985 [Candidatus Dormibacteraeota bacterium]|nr:hypothetical protein [Candidatus Dormibacteraeota bacterium]
MFISADRLTAPPVSECSTEPFKALLVSVIDQAIEDLSSTRWREDVDAFFSGSAFGRYCTLIGWNQEWMRRHIVA